MLLSKEYAAERRKLIDPRKASLEMCPGHGPKSNPEDPPSRKKSEIRNPKAERSQKSEGRNRMPVSWVAAIFAPLCACPTIG